MQKGLSLKVNKYIKLFFYFGKINDLDLWGSTLDHQKCHGGLTSTPPPPYNYMILILPFNI